MEDSQSNEPPKMPVRCSVVVHEEINEAENLEPKVCPLCKSKLKLYQIHFKEMFLMCSNIHCEFPFGVTDYHVYKIEYKDEFFPPEYRSISCSSMTTGSTLSQNDWSELDKLIPASESLFSPDGTLPQSFVDKPYDMEKLNNVKKSKEIEDKIKNDVKKIKDLNKTLIELDSSETINNEKWLESIAKMQERVGIQLLKENELEKVKTIKPHIGTGELKIDIDSTRNVISVQIGSENAESK